MPMHPPLSTDALAVFALTAGWSASGKPSDEPGDRLTPLTPREWARLAATLESLGATPSSLLNRSAHEVDHLVEGSAISAEAVIRLAARASALAMEAERLQSRGIWLLSIADEAYPARLSSRLQASAPPILYGAGDHSLLDRGGLAIVGARDADEVALSFASDAAAALARSGQQVVSGGAKGIDAAAMNSAADAGGTVVGVIADSLERKARSSAIRELISEERLVLLSSYGSDVPFSVGTAMGRNRLIYCLADAALVISSAEGEGGTWAGATEALKARWVPVYARTGVGSPAGNAALVRLGARSFAGAATDAVTLTAIELAETASEVAGSADPTPAGVEQQTLFALPPESPGKTKPRSPKGATKRAVKSR